MTSHAQKKAIRNYQKSKTRIVIWCDPEEKKEVERQATNAKKSLTEYCKGKILRGN